MPVSLISIGRSPLQFSPSCSPLPLAQRPRPLPPARPARPFLPPLPAFLRAGRAAAGGRLTAAPSVPEAGLQVCMALAKAVGVDGLGLRRRSTVQNVGAVGRTAIAGLVSVFGHFIMENPLLWHIDVG